MGIFDSVYVPCPHCGSPVEFQSKAAEEPYMNRYTLDDAPREIMLDIINRPEHCQKCDGWLALIDPQYPIDGGPTPHPAVRKVRTPDNPKTHFQGMKWWPEREEFTWNDVIDK